MHTPLTVLTMSEISISFDLPVTQAGPVSHTLWMQVFGKVQRSTLNDKRFLFLVLPQTDVGSDDELEILP